MRRLALLPLLFLPVASPLLADETPVVVISAPAEDDFDRHAGYYYPPTDSNETFVARADVIAEAERSVRIAFITGLTAEIAKRGQPVPFALFAKGADAQKLIIVALTDGPLDTIYRARAVLANLTAEARLLPILKQSGVDDYFTFFDLCRILGFEQITISDGKRWSHQVTLLSPQ